MCHEPASRKALVPGWQSVYAQAALQALEGDLDLPAQPISFPDILGGHFVDRHRRQQEKKARSRNRQWMHRLAIRTLLMPPAGRFLRAGRRLFVFAPDNEPGMEQRLASLSATGAGIFDPYLVFANVAGHHRAVNRIPVDQPAIERREPDIGPGHTHDEVRPGGHDLMERRSTGISAIAKHDVARSDGYARETFATVDIGEFQMREAGKGRLICRMKPEIRARAARPRDGTAVDDPQAARNGGVSRIRSLAQQRSGDVSQPVGRSAQSLQERNIGNRRHAVQTSLGCRGAQAHAAGSVSQCQPQQGLGVTNAAAPHKRPGCSRGRAEINDPLQLR